MRAAFIRRSIFAASSTVAMTLVAFTSAQPATEAASQPATPRPANAVRVMTYNIHHAAGSDGVVDLERIANIIRDADADIVALQEVDVKTKRCPMDQAAELGRLTGMTHRFGKAVEYQDGDYGQVLLTRWPTQAFEVKPLPGPATSEPRIALVATFEPTEGRPAFRFVATHLDHKSEPSRQLQVEAIAQIAPDSGERAMPTIIVGDLNAEPDSKVGAMIVERWISATPDNAMTSPASQPSKKIDWILFDKVSGWQTVDWRVVSAAEASDHLPVIATLRLDAK